MNGTPWGSVLQAGRLPHVKARNAKSAPLPKALEAGEAGTAQQRAAALAAARRGARPVKPVFASGVEEQTDSRDVVLEMEEDVMIHLLQHALPDDVE
jgi:hypothetical protein